MDTVWLADNEGIYSQEHWVWDGSDKSPDTLLSQDKKAAYFHVDPVKESTGTAGVRGTKGFTRGEHYWEITFLEPPFGTSVMVGVATKKAILHTDNFVNLIGLDGESWGLSHKGQLWHQGASRPYCRPLYEERVVIGVHLNLYDGTVHFYRNGVNLGLAFSGLNNLSAMTELFPVVSSTATSTELEVGVRIGRYQSLQLECLAIIARKLYSPHDVDPLPLPAMLKSHLCYMKTPNKLNV